MNTLRKLRSAACPFFWGTVLIVISSLQIHRQTLISYAKKRTYQELALDERTVSYKSWTSPIRLVFKVYVFNVTNPEAVMKGELPIFSECGPYVYDEILYKSIVDVDNKKDELTYTATARFSFSTDKSGSATMNDKVTILNPAYLGTINTLATLPANFMKQYGDHIAKLFPNRKTIFLTARVNDLLFGGVKIKCDPIKFPELEMICRVMKSKKPPIIKDTDAEGVYLFSFFDKINGSLQGPFSVNRGIKNITRLGTVEAVHGKNVLKFWNTKSCNELRGSVDSVLWPPMAEPKPVLSVFSADSCRAIDVQYKGKRTINGIAGYEYSLTEKMWSPEEIECYCPVVQKKPECLPRGLLDLSKCQEVPVILSEPHFLHADPKLLQYAKGLNPVPSRHLTYAVIEPRTGSPISGFKRTQLNLKLTKQPVELLMNVSDGYFPMLWTEEGLTPTLTVIAKTYQTQRTMQLLEYMQLIPLIVGIHIVLATLFLYGTPGHKPRKDKLIVESILLSSNSTTNDPMRRPPERPRLMFQ